MVVVRHSASHHHSNHQYFHQQQAAANGAGSSNHSFWRNNYDVVSSSNKRPSLFRTSKLILGGIMAIIMAMMVTHVYFAFRLSYYLPPNNNNSGGADDKETAEELLLQRSLVLQHRTAPPYVPGLIPLLFDSTPPPIPPNETGKRNATTTKAHNHTTKARRHYHNHTKKKKNHTSKFYHPHFHIHSVLDDDTHGGNESAAAEASDEEEDFSAKANRTRLKLEKQYARKAFQKHLSHMAKSGNHTYQDAYGNVYGAGDGVIISNATTVVYHHSSSYHAAAALKVHYTTGKYANGANTGKYAKTKPPLTLAPTIWKDDFEHWKAARDLNMTPFPRWGGDSDDGINLTQLLNFIDGLINGTATVLRWKTQRQTFPETPYIVSGEGLFVSHTIRKRTVETFRNFRVTPTEQVAALAIYMLKKDIVPPRTTTTLQQQRRTADEDEDDRYQRLKTALFQQSGFPFVAWYGDFTSCNYLNWNKSVSIPIFSTCASTTCNYSLPFPTYKTIHDARASQAEWRDQFVNYTATYSNQLPQKIQKVVWRGSLTGLYKESSPRSRIARFAHLHRSSGLLDIGLTSVPERKQKTEFNVTELFGGLVPKIKPMAAFQRYIAILDIDGNSWSSRFGTLLCYNSVIIKVEPHWVDYFHFKYLQPWIHYVPVKYDLSDLIDIAKYVTNPDNLQQMEQIVQNANHFCRTHMIHSAIAVDMLDVWQDYVKMLDKGNSNWHEVWKVAKQQYMAPDSPLKMIRRYKD